MELTVGFFVILTLTVIIFAGSLYFLRQFYTATETVRQQIDQDTESQILSLIRDGNVVAIPINKARLPAGNGASFWVGTQNILGEEKDFGLIVTFSKAFDSNEEQILQADPAYITQRWVLYSAGPHTIKNNDYKAIPVHIVAGDTIADSVNTPPGTYSFNVCLWDTSQYGTVAPGDCGISGANDVWYTGKVYKIFVEVP